MGHDDYSRIAEYEDEQTVTIQRNRNPIVLFYKQKRIIYVDFSDIKSADEILIYAEKSSALIRQNLPKSVLVLTNVKDMFFNRDVFFKLLGYMKKNDSYIKAYAVVGMSHLMLVFYTALIRFSGRNLKPFTSETDAKEYLSSR